MYDDQRDRKKHDFHDQLNMTRPYVQQGGYMVAGLDSADAVATCIARSLERRITHLFYTFLLPATFWADDAVRHCCYFGVRLANCSEYHFSFRFATQAGVLFFLLYLGGWDEAHCIALLYSKLNYS